MSHQWKGEQLPITSFFADSSWRSKAPRKENNLLTKKRKRKEADVEGELELQDPAGKRSAQENNGLLATGPDTNLGKNRDIPQQLAPPLPSKTDSRTKHKADTHPPSNRTVDVTTSHQIGLNPIDLTEDGDESPAKVSITPVSMNLSTSSSDRLLEGHRHEQLMTPPSTGLVKRITCQINMTKDSDSRPLTFKTPRFGFMAQPSFSQSGGATKRRQSPLSTPGVRQRVTSVDFAMPTPGSSAPRVKRMRLDQIVSDELDIDACSSRIKSNRTLPTDCDPASSPKITPPILRVSNQVTAEGIITSPLPKAQTSPSSSRKGIMSSPAEPGTSSDTFAFTSPVLPLHTPSKKDNHGRLEFSTSKPLRLCAPDFEIVATSQSQDLRCYIPSPPRMAGTPSFAIGSTPKALRFFKRLPELISPRRMTDISGEGDTPDRQTFGSGLVGTSQSQEVELDLSSKWTPGSLFESRKSLTMKTPGKTEQFILKANHLLRTPTKPKSPSPDTMVMNPPSFSTANRTLAAAALSKSSPFVGFEPNLPSSSPPMSQTQQLPRKHEHSQFYSKNSDFSNRLATPPKQSLWLFESQTLSPNLPRSFEDWRDTLTFNLNSDSATEPDSQIIELVNRTGGKLKASEVSDEVQSSPSQRTTCRSSATDVQSISKVDLSQIDTLPRDEEADAPFSVPDVLSSSMTEYSNEGDLQSQTPAPLRDFLDMFKGDGSFPDDFPESWRD